MAESEAARAPSPRIEWDSGTAYDLFASIFVLHRPEEFGLRASWAAGVRSRLSEDVRPAIADLAHFVAVPTHWIRNLPPPRDSRAVIQEMERMDPAVIPGAWVLAPCPDEPEAAEVIRRVITEGSWSASDVSALLGAKAAKGEGGKREVERKRLERWLDSLCRPEELGRKLVQGMTEFRESFFREEERRIAPAVEQALAKAKERSRSLDAADLLEELSQGLRLGHLLNRPRLLLVPCYWCSPRIIYGCLDDDCRVVLFGARPPEASLVPEDQVPAALSLALTALADPTRLNILRLLREERLTQAQISRKLRLRPSTIFLVAIL